MLVSQIRGMTLRTQFCMMQLKRMTVVGNGYVGWKHKTRAYEMRPFELRLWKIRLYRHIRQRFGLRCRFAALRQFRCCVRRWRVFASRRLEFRVPLKSTPAAALGPKVQSGGGRLPKHGTNMLWKREKQFGVNFSQTREWEYKLSDRGMCDGRALKTSAKRTGKNRKKMILF